MVAVGADVKRTCNCALVRADMPSEPMEIKTYKPGGQIVVGAIDPAGKPDAETLIVTVHYFDGKTPCAVKR